MKSRFRRLAATVLLGPAMLTSACSATPAASSVVADGAGSQPSSAGTPAYASRSPVVTTQPTLQSLLVGEWQGTHDCTTIQTILADAGFAEHVSEVVVGEGLIPGVTDPTELEDPTDPCRGAIQHAHYHFFTADGQFGSLDNDRNQVDDGRYAVVSKDTVEINGTPFEFEFTSDSLTLRPADLGPDCDPGFCPEVWKLMVALPGTIWKRSG
jgi:hypothetical protein